jgi:hypothetical protein
MGGKGLKRGTKKKMGEKEKNGGKRKKWRKRKKMGEKEGKNPRTPTSVFISVIRYAIRSELRGSTWPIYGDHELPRWNPNILPFVAPSLHPTPNVIYHAPFVQ